MHDLSEKYLELLTFGATSDDRLMNDDIARHREWHEAIEALAAADGLRATRSTEMIGAGSFHVPWASLVRPDGSHYPSLTDEHRFLPQERERTLGMIEADWGHVLKAARGALGRA